MCIADVLSALRDAGLGSLPGGGAEIFDDRVHDQIFKGKVREDRWFEVHRIATAWASTPMPPCSTATLKRPLSASIHLIKLRQLQTESLKKQPRKFQLRDPAVVHPRAKRLDISQPNRPD